MLGVAGKPVHQSSEGWVPVYADANANSAPSRLGCMSVGFLLKKREDSVVWRGPKKNAMIRQFLSDVRWGELDYLVIDTPPGTYTILLFYYFLSFINTTCRHVLLSSSTFGTSFTPCKPGTSDEHLSLLEHLAPLGSRLSSIIVTTPQAVALADALKCLSFTRTVSLPVLGVIENMSGYVCPCCGEISNIFSKGGGESMANKEGLTFLGGLPVDTELVTLLDAAESTENVDKEANGQEKKVNEGTDSAESFPLLDRYLKTSSWKLFKEIVSKALENLNGTEVKGQLPRTDVNE